jgi:Icc-related predicted phosphoesterase
VTHVDSGKNSSARVYNLNPQSDVPIMTYHGNSMRALIARTLARSKWLVLSDLAIALEEVSMVGVEVSDTYGSSSFRELSDQGGPKWLLVRTTKECCLFR